MKTCSFCGTTKPLLDFHKNVRRRDGCANECKVCAGERVKKWREDNPDKFKAAQQAHYAKTAEAQRQRAKQWHHVNKEKAKQSAAQWRAANAEKIKAKKRLDATGFTEAQFGEALRRQNGECAICRTGLSDLPPRQVHADHDHNTGKPRGVLCHHCNVALGHLKDSEELLQAAIDYLQSPPMGDVE